MVSIGSDLTVTKESDIEELSRLKNFVFLQTTLDGSTPETCEKFRGKGNFHKVIKGMELMQKHKVPFIVGTVLTKYNVNEIEKVGHLVSRYGAKGYCFSPLYIAGRGISLVDALPTNEDLLNANTQFRKLVEENVIRPADSAWNEITKDIDEEEFKKMLDNQSFLTRTGERLVRIDPKGHVYVSVKLKRLLVENDKEWNAGNIKNEKLLRIWQGSEDLNKWRNLKQVSNHPTFGQAIDVRAAIEFS
jgi:MoaA/NifB/PqqE/SkfB family radical SAM enzyme